MPPEPPLDASAESARECRGRPPPGRSPCRHRCRRSPRTRPGRRPSRRAAWWTRPGWGLRQSHPSDSVCGQTTQASNGPSSASIRALTASTARRSISPRPMPDWLVITAIGMPAPRSRCSAVAAPGIGSTRSGSPLYGTSSTIVPSRSTSTAAGSRAAALRRCECARPVEGPRGHPPRRAGPASSARWPRAGWPRWWSASSAPRPGPGGPGRIRRQLKSAVRIAQPAAAAAAAVRRRSSKATGTASGERRW